MARCATCGAASPLTSRAIGVCRECLVERPEAALKVAMEGHRASRAEFGLPPEPPRSPGGKPCNLCAARCVMADGEVGYCGIRGVRGGRMWSLSGTDFGLLDYYLDPHVTNCCNAWFCPAGTGCGYPKFAVREGPEVGYYILALFFYGCSLNCQFCLPPDVLVLTDEGMKTISQLFRKAPLKLSFLDHEEAYPASVYTITHTGRRARVLRVFRHWYEGELIALKPALGPPLECTPSHRLFVSDGPDAQTVKTVRADEVRSGSYLVTPRPRGESADAIDVEELLARHSAKLREPVRVTEELAAEIAVTAGNGLSGGTTVEEDGTVRSKGEERSCIPRFITLNEELAEILGLYCARGRVTRGGNGPHAHRLVISFGHRERGLVRRAVDVLESIFGVKCTVVERATSITVEIDEPTLASLFGELCGQGPREKHVPPRILLAPANVVKSFLRAYLKGDDRTTRGYVVASTSSKRLAFEILWLMIGLGMKPALYTSVPPRIERTGTGRVGRSRLYVIKVEERSFDSRMSSGAGSGIGAANYISWRIESVERRPYSGYVYNIEVDCEDHSYIANCIAVKNCQNWTHKALSRGKRITTRELVEVTLRNERITCWCWFGGSAEPQLPFAVNASRTVLEEKGEGRIVRICWEWNGDGNPALVRRAAELSLTSGGNVKFDLKAFTKSVHVALTGMDNEEILRNFELVYDEFYERRRDVPVLGATTLLVPQYVNEREVDQIARFIASLDPEIPYSLLVFHPDFKMNDVPVTPERQVWECYRAAKRHLRNVNVGNLHLLALWRSGFSAKLL
ncbi:MAG: hypothetical protein ABDH63_01305 [Candidatus Caldarchaeales archaeon]